MNASHFVDGAQQAWDATSLSWAYKCPRYYQLKMIDRWQPRRKSVHLLFGGWYATALEHYYKYRALGDDSQTALVKVVKEAMIDTWEHHIPTMDDPKEWWDEHPEAFLYQPLPGSGKAWTSDHPTKTRENLIRSIIWYVAQFEDEQISVLQLADGKPAVELSFSFEADNGITFCGHLDRVVEYSGDVYVMDQKTTGSTITPYYFDQFSPDNQMSLYTFAGKIIYKTPVKGVIIDAAQIAVGFTRYARGFTYRTDTQLDEWYEQTLAFIDSFNANVRKGIFPMNPASCGNYGGCEFRAVCSRSPEVRKHYLAADFTQGEQWNPLTRR